MEDEDIERKDGRKGREKLEEDDWKRKSFEFDFYDSWYRVDTPRKVLQPHHHPQSGRGFCELT